MYCLGYLKCALSCCDTQVVPRSSRYSQDLLQAAYPRNMALPWQTMALSIPTAVRAVLRSRFVRSGLTRGKGGPLNRKGTLTKHFLVSLKFSGTITPHLNRQNLSPNFALKYELMLCKPSFTNLFA